MFADMGNPTRHLPFPVTHGSSLTAFCWWNSLILWAAILGEECVSKGAQDQSSCACYTPSTRDSVVAVPPLSPAVSLQFFSLYQVQVSCLGNKMLVFLLLQITLWGNLITWCWGSKRHLCASLGEEGQPPLTMNTALPQGQWLKKSPVSPFHSPDFFWKWLPFPFLPLHPMLVITVLPLFVSPEGGGGCLALLCFFLQDSLSLFLQPLTLWG